MYGTPQSVPSWKKAKSCTYFGVSSSTANLGAASEFWLTPWWHWNRESAYQAQILTRQWRPLLIPVSALELQTLFTLLQIHTTCCTYTCSSFDYKILACLLCPTHCLPLFWIFLPTTSWVIAPAGTELWQWPASHPSSHPNMPKWERISEMVCGTPVQTAKRYLWYTYVA